MGPHTESHLGVHSASLEWRRVNTTIITIVLDHSLERDLLRGCVSPVDMIQGNTV
jgi:hypothetical protein